MLHTRGGPLIYEKQPAYTSLSTILMFLLGIFMIVVLLLTNLTNNAKGPRNSWHK